MTARDLQPGIADIAVYLPEATVDDDEIKRRFGFDQKFLDEKLGIHSRHIAASDETVADMAVAAGARLFERGSIDRERIDLVLLCTQNPDYRLPTTANLVQDRLGLSTACAALDINQGCSGFVYGLSVVRGMMASEGLSSALLITSEAYSKVMNPDDRNTVPLFGDGAAATLITAGGTGHIGQSRFGSDGSGADVLIVRGGGGRYPNRLPVGEDGLFMNGRAVFEFMMKRVPRNVTECLAANELSADEVDLFVFHQASLFMVSSLTRALKLPPDKVPFVLADGGNTVSSTLPMALERIGGCRSLAGKTVLLSGFGVGLSWASTVIRFSEMSKK